MEFLSVKEIADKWHIQERMVRLYCKQGRVDGAQLVGNKWIIPADAAKPQRQARKKTMPRALLERLVAERSGNFSGGIYHKTQIEMTYNSNHIEGSRLTHEQTRYIFETNTIGIEQGHEAVRIDDVIETVNHFRCIDYIIDHAKSPLSERLILKLHYLLKAGTSDADKDWFVVGGYKKLENEVDGRQTTLPENVASELQQLLANYAELDSVELEDLLEFHVRFERIHPFQDGNGRVGRLILFKECLKYRILPFIIEDQYKYFYYRGLRMWDTERGYLLDTCRYAQDVYASWLDYFHVSYQR